MRTLLGEKSRPCKIPADILTQHFTNPATSHSEDLPGWLTDRDPTAANSNTSDDLTHRLSENEVEAQLKRLPWQSSPGPDSVDYRLWKATPASSALLTEIYNTCLANNRTPASWKKSNTILIHPRVGMSHRRGTPCSQQSTRYSRPSWPDVWPSWATLEGRISPSQKGFLPMEGCVEHSIVMESLLCDAKRRRKDVRILWLDLKNAFGSVSHDLLWFMLMKLEVSEPFIAICQEIYADSSQRIRTNEDTPPTSPSMWESSRGCPLGPLLFNFALEALLPILNTCSTGYSMENGSLVK